MQIKAAPFSLPANEGELKATGGELEMEAKVDTPSPQMPYIKEEMKNAN